LYKNANQMKVEEKDWVIELNFNLEKLYLFNKTIKQIAQIIRDEESFAKMECIPSPNNIAKIIIYIDYSSVVESVLKKIDLDTGNEIQLINENNLNYFYTRDIVIKSVVQIKLGGIDGIQKIFPKEVTENNVKEWVIDTQGCNFSKASNLKICDFKRSSCDDFWQIYKTLGIEAVRELLITEFTKCLSFDGSYINPRHVELLVDSMTCSGNITSVRREGIDRSCGPLAKCAFEKTLDNFAYAATFSEKENITGVSASITLGKLIHGGTGFSDIIVDPKFIRKPKKIPTFGKTKSVMTQIAVNY